MRRRALLVGVVATAIAVVAVSSAASAPQALSYSRMSAVAQFAYDLDYGSHPDSAFNGTYSYILVYRVNAIVVYDGRGLSTVGSMLADGGARIDMQMTQWVDSSTRRRVRCPAAGSQNGQGLVYESSTAGGRFSGGGGVGVSNTGLSVNPGRAVKWSIGCSATEGLATHGLPGGPTLRVAAPAKSRFTGTKRFITACTDSYEHDWDPGEGIPGAHKFSGNVYFSVQFTPFPASQLVATRQRLRDQVGDRLGGPRPQTVRACP